MNCRLAVYNALTVMWSRIKWESEYFNAGLWGPSQSTETCQNGIMQIDQETI